MNYHDSLNDEENPNIFIRMFVYAFKTEFYFINLYNINNLLERRIIAKNE